MIRKKNRRQRLAKPAERRAQASRSNATVYELATSDAKVQDAYGMCSKTRSLFAPWSHRATILSLLVCFILACLWYGDFILAVNREGVFDWAKESYIYRYLYFYTRSEGLLPLSFFGLPPDLLRYPALAMSSSYWANPEVPTLSPFPLLADFLSFGAALKTYYALHIVAGILGILYLSKVLRLTPFMGCLLCVLTMLNPYHMQHWAIAYTPYVTLFLVPWVIGLLIDERASFGRMVSASLLLALMLYEGGLHPFMWLIAAIAVVTPLACLRQGTFRPLQHFFSAIFLATLLLAPKLIAVKAHFKPHRLPSASYRTLDDLWQIFNDSQSPLYDLPAAYSRHNINWYDGSFYMGSGWFVLLLVACSAFAWRICRGRESLRVRLSGIELVAGAMVFVVLGWGSNWLNLAKILPFLAAQVYPWRFLVVAVALLCVFAVRELDWLLQYMPKGWPRLVAWFVVLLVAGFTTVDQHARQRQFSEVAISEPTRLPEFTTNTMQSLSPALGLLPAQQVERLNVSFAEGCYRVHIPANQNKLLFVVPWLLPSFNRDFQVFGATLADHSENGPIFRADDGRTLVIFKPVSSGALKLGLISLGLFCGTVAVLCGRKLSIQANIFNLCRRLCRLRRVRKI